MPKKVLLIASDFPIYEKYCPNFTGMMDGLEKLGIEHKLISCRPQLNVDDVISYNADLIIYCLLDMVKHPEWRKEIRKKLPNAKIVMWYGDLRNNETGQVRDNMSEIDMMFVSNNAQSEYYKKRWKVKECYFLPLGASIRNVEYDKKYDFDFVFLGSKITGSVFMDRCAEIGKFQEEGLKLVNADAQRQPELRAKILKMMPTIYRSSKICLDVSHFTNIDGYTSNRFWNIGASGGVALTKRFPGCTDFYPEDSRIYFDTFTEAIRLKDYYLENPKLLEPIRKRALEVAERHTYDKRFLEMFDKIYCLTH